MRRIVGLLFLALILSTCARPPAPTATAPVIAAAPRPTNPAEATATPVPTIPPSATPTNTPTPEPTATPAPTGTPTATLTPTATPVPVMAGTPIAGAGAVIAVDNVTQLAELADWGRGVINDVAYSGDGRWIAVGAATGVYVHAAADLSLEPRFIETAASVRDVAISGDGSLVALIDATWRVELWRVASRERLWVKEDKVWLIQFAPDGGALAAVTTVGRDSLGVIWSVPAGDILQTFPGPLAMRFSPDGTKLAVWEYKEVAVYAWPGGELLRRAAPVLFVAGGEGEELEADDTIIVDVQFDAQGEPILINSPYDAAYGPTGRIEFQAGSDGGLLLSLPPIARFAIDTDNACDEPVFYAEPPAFPSAWQFALASRAQIAALKYQVPVNPAEGRVRTSVRIRRLDNGQLLYTQEGVAAFAFSPDGVTWVSGRQDGRLEVRRIADGSLLQSYDGYESPLTHLAVASDSQFVAATYLDEVKVYDAVDGSLLWRYPAAVRAALAPDGTIALGYESGLIELRDAVSGTLRYPLAAHTAAITALAFTPTGAALVSAGMDCQLNVWDVPAGTLAHSLENYLVTSSGTNSDEALAIRVWDLLVMPDGQWVVGTFSSDIGLWQLADSRLPAVHETQYRIDDLAFSPAGEFLALASYPVYLWQVGPDDTVQTAWQREMSATAVAFSADGALLLLGLDEHFVDEDRRPNERLNGALQIHLVQDGELWHILSPGTRRVTAIAFAPNGQYFVSAALDGVIRLWGIP